MAKINIFLDEIVDSPYLKKSIKDKLEAFTDRFPFDSNIKVWMQKRDGMFQAKMMVKYFQGDFSCSGWSEKDPFSAAESLIDNMHAQLNQWYKVRFEELIPVQNRKALIIDDDITSVLPLKTALFKANCAPVIVTDVKDAFMELISNKFDMIFLDWNMPALNGPDTIERVDEMLDKYPPIKSIWYEHNLPVVTFSGDQVNKSQFPTNLHSFTYMGHLQKQTKYSKLTQITRRYLDQLDSNQIKLNL